MKKVVFTDLDGTLLDLKTYSFMKSVDAIEALQKIGFPIVFCSSKTRKEQEFYRESLGIKDPFIVENGSAIYIPKGYFKTQIPFNTYVIDDYEVIPLGCSVEKIRSELMKQRSKHKLDFCYYDELQPEEVSMITGLDMTSAKRAMTRDFSETILRGEVSQSFHQSIEKEGLRSIPGSKYQTVISRQADKGKAVEILKLLYQNEFKTIETIGIGDSKNDEEMLASVDHPFLVQRPSGDWAVLEDTPAKGVVGVGPEGWNKVIRMLLK